MTAEARPLVTFALFAYNQERFIAEAVDGALAQTYEPLEIILSDDGSSDRTFEIMREKAAAYRGPHHVIVRRNQPNAGLAEHVNVVCSMASGEIMVFAAGDDISLPERTTLSVEHLRAAPEATFVNLNLATIDANSTIITPRQKAFRRTRRIELAEYLKGRQASIKGAARAVRRRVFDEFGPLDPSCPTEDTPFLLRSLMMGPGVLVSEVAVHYRVHENNLSLASSRRKMNTEAIFRQYERDITLAGERRLITASQTTNLRSWVRRRRVEAQPDERLSILRQLVRRVVGR
jgi:glycosyltransferase involved in cell wall biosynthesis